MQTVLSAPKAKSLLYDPRGLMTGRRLAGLMSTVEARRLVREVLRARGDWRADRSGLRERREGQSAASMSSERNRRWLFTRSASD